MRLTKQIYSLVGLLVVGIYITFTLAAYLYFPGAYSPTHNWLSDLGDSHQNPGGAVIYNLGIMLTAFLVLLSFLGFARWGQGHHPVQNLMVRLTQFFGVLGCLALGLSAIFPINQIDQHRFWSISFYILTGTAFIFSLFALRYLPKWPLWALVLGGTAALIDVLSGIFSEVTVLEWLTVALFLGYTLMLNIKNPPEIKEGKS